MPPEFSVSEKEEQEFTAFLQEKIRRYNCDHSPSHRQARQPGALTPLNLILRDDSGRMIGGLTANSYWDWLEIEHFYLPEALRGGGRGRAMLQTAETIALKRGCHHCFLTTYEFQARLFYEKQGYAVVGQLDDYPPGSTYYWMRKELSSNP